MKDQQTIERELNARVLNSLRAGTKKEQLAVLCAEAGIYYRTWSPGDGCTRYRFFRGVEQHNSYFGPEDGIYTALGIRSALDFARTYGSGIRDGYGR